MSLQATRSSHASCEHNVICLTSVWRAYCRGLAAGGIALGSKVAMMAKAGGGASGVLKGIGALTAAGDACHCMNVLKLARMQT